MQKFKNKNKKGFTLIELLVVIAIISVLASLLMANFVGVRQRARDAQRKSDLHQIQSALELYRADNGNYPTQSSGIILTPCGASFSYNGVTYMQKVPCDPLGATIGYNSGGNYGYAITNGNNTSYNLCACLENANDKDANVTSNSLGCASTKFVCFQNP